MVNSEKYQQRFTDKVDYLSSNAYFITSLFNLNDSSNNTLDKLEVLLLKDNDLKDNEGYNYFERLKIYKDTLLKKSFYEYLIREYSLLEILINKSVGEKRKQYLKSYQDELRNMTYEDYIKSLSPINLLDDLENYVNLQQNIKIKLLKIKVIKKYSAILCEKFPCFSTDKNYEIFLSPKENQHLKSDNGVKLNKFIKYFSENNLYNDNSIFQRVKEK